MQPKLTKLINANPDIGRRTLCLFMDETGHDEFKSGQRFFAIGGIAGFGPQVKHGARLLHPLMVDELARMIGDLTTVPSNVLICLEHTELLTPKIIEAMPAISLEIHDTDVPAVGIFIHKGASEPLLEMADHLTWHAERQHKDQTPGKELMLGAMFPRGAPYAIYRELRLGKMSGGDEPRWQLSFTDHEPAIARPHWRTRRSVGA